MRSSPRTPAPPSAFRVLAYRHTGNLGDAVQTVALCRLLGTRCLGVYRDEPYPAACADVPLVINGWLGHEVPAKAPRAVFAGIHVGGAEAAHVAWLRQGGAAIGARDPFTLDLLRGCGIPTELIGCATLTWPRYRGPRRGRFSIDVAPRPGTVYLSNRVGDISWDDQWKLAVERMAQLKTAEVVYSNRLHVVLPCLAFGTPVVYPLSELSAVQDKHRLTLLGALGFRYDEDVTLDVEPWADRYVTFLQRALDITITPASEPRYPRAMTRHALERDARPEPHRRTRRSVAGRSSPRIFFLFTGSTLYSTREHEVYRHVAILTRHACDAYVLDASGHGEAHPAGAVEGRRAAVNGHEAAHQDGNVHERDHVRVVSLAALGKYYDPAHDIVVCSERTARYLITAAGRKVLSVRRASFLAGALTAGYHARDIGLIGALASSPALAGYIQVAMPGLPAFVVHDTPDRETFPFRSWHEKQPLIVLATDAPDEAASVLPILRCRAHLGRNRFERFRCVPTRGASSENVAAYFADAILVLATDSDAGAAVQTEARSSGCIVVTLGGAPDERRAPGLRQFKRGDLAAMIAFVEQVMDDFLERRLSSDAPSADDVRETTTDIAGNQEREVLAAWHGVLAASRG